ncbi:MAG: hypothetical protein HMLKMBBP_01100 [Planctomycetes bacterium]|nr:hypothetical protein [Planctomycetota bacterium]
MKRRLRKRRSFDFLRLKTKSGMNFSADRRPWRPTSRRYAITLLRLPALPRMRTCVTPASLTNSTHSSPFASTAASKSIRTSGSTFVKTGEPSLASEPSAMR